MIHVNTCCSAECKYQRAFDVMVGRNDVHHGALQFSLEGMPAFAKTLSSGFFWGWEESHIANCRYFGARLKSGTNTAAVIHWRSWTSVICVAISAASIHPSIFCPRLSCAEGRKGCWSLYPSYRRGGEHRHMQTGRPDLDSTQGPSCCEARAQSTTPLSPPSMQFVLEFNYSQQKAMISDGTAL